MHNELKVKVSCARFVILFMICWLFEILDESVWMKIAFMVLQSVKLERLNTAVSNVTDAGGDFLGEESMNLGDRL
jgi:diacylglycerol kinase